MIKRILSLVILLSFIVTGIAFSAQIPDVTQPASGPEKWQMSVFNNSGAALDDGDLVIWDVGSSTGDDDMYVTTSTTAGTGPIAGVVEGSIAIASTGSITVYGVTNVDTDGGGVTGAGTNMTVGSQTGTATTIGSRTNAHLLGVSVAATASNSTQIFVNPGYAK